MTAIPANVNVPPGSTVFGAGSPTEYPNFPFKYSLGPSDFTCQWYFGNGSTFVIDLNAPGAKQPALEFVFSPGSPISAINFGCAYIPFVHSASIARQDSCDPAAAGDTVVQVATGRLGLYAAVVTTPPGTKDPNLATSGVLGTATIAVYIVQEPNCTQQGGCPMPDLNSGADAQAAECTLADAQRAVCASALKLFIDQSDGAQGKPDAVAAIIDAIDKASGSPPTPPATVSGDQPECRGNGDVELESKINKSANTKISIPDKGIALPAGLPGAVTVSFVPGDAKICKNNTSPVLNTPGGFVSGELSLSASDAAGQPPTHGPFVYSAAATAWTEVPGAPPGPRITHFPSAKFEAAVDPQLVALFSKSGPTLGVQIASAKLIADLLTVTLVSENGALLQVGLAPALELSVIIDKETIEKAVEAEEASGVGEAAAIEDVAGQVAGDAVVGLDLEVSEYYGVILPISEKQVLFASVRTTLSIAFGEDVVITSFSVSVADPVVTDIAPADVAAIDAEIGAGDVIAVGGLEDLLLIFVL